MRLALGIRRRRLIGGLVLEALLLAIGGGGLALLVAHWGGQAVRRFLLPNIDWTGAPVDGRVLAVAAVVTLLTVILAALLPAVQTSRPDLGRSLKAGTPGAGRDPRHARTRRALLVLQTALSVLLLSGAGLFVTSLLLCLVVAFAARQNRLGEVVIVALALAVFSILLFGYALGLTMPLWPV